MNRILSPSLSAPSAVPITSRGLLERTGLRRDKERERERERDHKDRISQPLPITQQQQQQQLPYQQYSSNATPPLSYNSPRQFSSSSGSSPALPLHRTPQRQQHQHHQQPGLPRTSSDRSDYARSVSDDAGPARSSEGASRQRPPTAPQASTSQQSHQESLIDGLVHRIVSRLPHRSGDRRLASLSTQEHGLANAVQALLDLSRHRLAYILPILQAELELIIKLPSSVPVPGSSLSHASLSASPYAPAPNGGDGLDGGSSLDNLRSQMLLVELIASCLASQWELSEGADKGSRVGMADPPPLEDRTAKQLLGTVTFLLRQDALHGRGRDTKAGQTASPLLSGTMSPVFNASQTSLGGSTAATPRTRHSTSRSANFARPTSPASHVTSVSATASGKRSVGVEHDRLTIDGVFHSLLQSAARITAYISASRWDIVLSRLRNRLAYYCNPKEELPELHEVRLFEFCSLDEHRFTALLAELNSSLVQMRRSAQAAVCTAVRNAIWQFTAGTPGTLPLLYGEQRRAAFTGIPEALFDTVFAIADSSKRKNHTWPLLATLLPYCPAAVVGLTGGSGSAVEARGVQVARKGQYLDLLRRAVRGGSSAGSRDLNLALSCYSDLCYAASYVSPTYARSESTSSSREVAGLRLLASEMEMELRTSLLDPARPILSSSGEIDSDLIAEGLAALGKLHFAHLRADLLPRLLSSSKAVPYQFRSAAIHACSAILASDEKVPWHPGREDVAIVVGPLVRELLQRAVTSTFGTGVHGQPTLSPDARSRNMLEDEGSMRNETVQALLQLFSQDNSVLFTQVEQGVHQPSNGWSASELVRSDPQDPSNSISLLCCLLDDCNLPAIRQDAASVLLDIYNSEASTTSTAAYANACAPAVNAALIRWYLQLSAADTAGQCAVLETHSSWLSALAHLLRSADDYGTCALPQIIAGSELVGILSLCSNDDGVRHCSAQLFHQLDDLVQVPASSSPRSNVTSAARSLRDEGPSVIGGTVAQARRMHKVFTSLTERTPAISAAWEEAFRQWSAFAARFGVAGFEPRQQEGEDAASLFKGASLLDTSFMKAAPPTEDDMGQWIQLSGFLVTTLGLYRQKASAQADAPINLADLFPHDQLPSRFYGTPAREVSGERFLPVMVDLLWAEHARMRDAGREIIGTYLDPAHAADLAARLHLPAEKFAEQGRFEAASEEVTLYFDQTLAVIVSLLPRLPAEHQLDVNTVRQLEHVILAAAYYAHKLGQGAGSTRLRNKISRTVQSLLDSQLGQQGLVDPAFRNLIVDYLLAYLADTNQLEQGKSRYELEASCLQALSSCLKGLIVRRFSDKPVKGDPVTDVRILHAGIDRLLPYTSDQVQSQPATEWAPHDRLRSVDSRLSTAAAASVAQLQAQARTAAREAIANAILANLPASSPHIARLAKSGSSPDSTAILVRVLEGWPEGMYTTPTHAAEDIYSDLIEAICAPDLHLALAIAELCPHSAQEGVLDLLMQLLDSRGLAVDLLKAIIEKEVTETEHEATLFRGNSSATRLLTAFARSRGYGYTRFLVNSLLSTLSAQPLGLADLDMYSDASADDDSLVKLEALAEAFLGLICDTWYYIPTEMRELCSHMHMVVKENYPDSVYTAIGGWVFLRYINPAIISPEIVDLDVPEDAKETRRALVLISKLLQALSNNIRFKEPGMKTLNSFVTNHILDMTTFLGQISAPLQGPRGGSRHNADDVSTFDKRLLYTFAWANTERIGSILLTRVPPDVRRHSQNGSVSDRASIDLPHTSWSALTDILWDIRQKGENFDDRKPTPRPRELTDMLRIDVRDSKDSSPWKGVVRSGLAARDGSPAICIVMHRLSTTTTDFDSLLRYTLLEVSRTTGDFDLLLDCSSFEDRNAAPPDVIELLLALAPTDAMERLRRVYIFSPTCAFLHFGRKLAAVTSSSPLEKRIHFIHDVHELEDHFPVPAAVLAPETVRTISDNVVAVTTAVLVGPDRLHQPCALRFGERSLELTTTKKRAFIGDLRCNTTDILAYSEIRLVRVVQSLYGSADHEIETWSGKRFLLVQVEDPEIFSKLLSIQSRNDGLGGHALATQDSSDRESTQAALLAAALRRLASSKPQERLDGQTLFARTLKVFQLLSGGIPDVPDHVPLSACFGYIGDSFDKLSEQQLHLTGDVIISILHALVDVPTAQATRMLVCVRPWCANLNAYWHSDTASARGRVHQILQLLLELPLRDNMFQTYLQTRIWPIIVKADALLSPLIETLSASLARSDLCDSDAELLTSAIASSGSTLLVRGKIYKSIRKLLHRAAASEAATLEQAKEWQSVRLLLTIDNALASPDRTSSQILAPELVLTIIAFLGVGDEQARSNLDCLIWSLDRHLRSSPSKEAIQSELQRLAQDVIRASQDLSEILQVDAAETGQDSNRPQAVEAIDSASKALVAMLSNAEAPADTINTWKARLSSNIVRHCVGSDNFLQCRCLVLLSHLNPDDTVLGALLTNLRSNLETNMNSNTLQAYLICFTRFLQASASPQRAAQLFWLAIGTSQAHPVLLAVSIRLLGAAAKCMARHGFDNAPGLHSFLIANRKAHPDVAAAAKGFDTAIEADFTESNFAFAVAALLSKGLRQADAALDTIGLFRTLAVLSTDGPLDGQTNGHGNEGQQVVNSLGYLLPLLSATAIKNGTFTLGALLQLAGLDNGDPDFASGPYHPMLAHLEFDRNEPLVLAASLAMSLLQAAHSDEEKIVLLAFLREVAELAPAVVQLLEPHLMPLLSDWLRTTEYNGLQTSAGDLLHALLSASPDTQMGNLDITTYVSALGFPNILTCASHTAFVANAASSPHLTRQKLRCCADLLGALLQHQG